MNFCMSGDAIAQVAHVAGSFLHIDGWIFFLFIAIGYGTLSLSRKNHLPEPVILFVLGVLLQHIIHISYSDLILFISLSALLVIFDAGAHFIPRHFSHIAHKTLDFVLISLVLYTLFSGIFLHLFFFAEITLFSIFISIMVAALLTSSSQFEILGMFKYRQNKLFHLTMLEDHISTPIMLFVVLTIFSFLKYGFLSGLSMLFIDVVVGFFIGLFAIHIKRLNLSFIIPALALLVYILSIYLGGLGFIAVLVVSLFFHNSVQSKPDMHEFNDVLRHFAYVFLFICAGYLVQLHITVISFSVFLFAVYLLVRYMLIKKMFRHARTFLTFDCPKGLAVISMALLVFTSTNLMSSIIVITMLTITAAYVLNLFVHTMTVKNY